MPHLLQRELSSGARERRRRHPRDHRAFLCCQQDPCRSLLHPHRSAQFYDLDAREYSSFGLCHRVRGDGLSRSEGGEKGAHRRHPRRRLILDLCAARVPHDCAAWHCSLPDALPTPSSHCMTTIKCFLLQRRPLRRLFGCGGPSPIAIK